jgi:hypothetical protein
MAGMAAFALAALGLGPSLVGLGLRIVVEGSCPSAAAVEAQLQPLLPSDSERDERLRALSAHIEPLDELLRVEVRSESGGLLTVRDLERAAPCPALAAAAAVVIASAVASLPRAAPEPPPAPLPPPPPPPPRPPRLSWEVGAAAVLAMTSQALTGGGSLEVQLSPPRLFGQRPSRFGVRVGATAMGLRRQLLPVDANAPDGAVDWMRVQVLVAPRYRLWLDRPLVEVYAGMLGAAVLTTGSGFLRSYRGQGFDLGIAGGLRVGRGWERLSLWGELGFAGWLIPQELVLAGSPPSARLPAWDILLSVGSSIGRR